MALSRQQIIDAALDILRTYGLADLSMRRLARDLQVQPGALYWHVKNKQELLGVLAERILGPAPEVPEGGSDPEAEPQGASQAVRQTARQIRDALLSVRDGADVVSLAHALNPQSLAPICRLRTLLAESPLTEQQARWGARTLTHYILGAVAEEQTQAELAAAGLLPQGEQPAGDPEDGNTDAFLFGLDVILDGLQAVAGN